MMQSIIYACYWLIALFVAVTLIREVVRARRVQDVMLFSIILVPFILRILHLK